LKNSSGENVCFRLIHCLAWRRPSNRQPISASPTTGGFRSSIMILTFALVLSFVQDSLAPHDFWMTATTPSAEARISGQERPGTFRSWWYVRTDVVHPQSCAGPENSFLTPQTKTPGSSWALAGMGNSRATSMKQSAAADFGPPRIASSHLRCRNMTPASTEPGTRPSLPM
jgi:hypothetical protein